MKDEDSYYALQWKSNSTLSNHGIFATEKDAFESIEMWWNLNGFSPKYVRHWHKDNRMIIDYGLHDCFYYITKVNQDNFGKVLFPKKYELARRHKSIDKMEVKEIEDELEDLIGNITGTLWKGVPLPSFYLH